MDEDRLWVTTSHGLHVREHGTWHRFTKRDGLRDDNMMFLTVRKNHEVCASYLLPYGLTCLRYAGGAITNLRHIDATSGLNSNIFEPFFTTKNIGKGLGLAPALIDCHAAQPTVAGTVDHGREPLSSMITAVISVAEAPARRSASRGSSLP